MGIQTTLLVLVALNSVFQVVFYSLYAWIFITILPTWFGLRGTVVNVGIGQIAPTCSLYLGIPFSCWNRDSVCALVRAKGEQWYRTQFYTRESVHLRFSPCYSRSWVMFSLKGDLIVKLSARRAAYRSAGC